MLSTVNLFDLLSVYRWRGSIAACMRPIYIYMNVELTMNASTPGGGWI